MHPDYDPLDAKWDNFDMANYGWLCATQVWVWPSGSSCGFHFAAIKAPRAAI